MAIKIVCIGKNKNNPIKTLIEEYILRIKAYSDIEFVFLPDIRLTKTNSPQIVINNESNSLMKYISSKERISGKASFFIVLDKDGNSYNSSEFAVNISRKLDNFDLHFLIGGVYGISNEVKKKSRLVVESVKLNLYSSNESAYIVRTDL